MKRLAPSKHPVAQRRRALKLSGYRLAIKSGVSSQQIFAIERGRVRFPRVDIAIRLARTLAVDVAELFPLPKVAA